MKCSVCPRDLFAVEHKIADEIVMYIGDVARPLLSVFDVKICKKYRFATHIHMISYLLYIYVF